MCEADANAVDLGRMNKHYYDLGRYVSRFDRVGYIGPMLVDVSSTPTTINLNDRNKNRHLNI